MLEKRWLRNCCFAGLVAMALVSAPSVPAQQQPAAGGGAQATAAEQTDNVAVILEEVTGVAERLKESLDQLPNLIEQAKDSEKNAEALLANLEALVREVSARVAEDSALWTQLSELQQQWMQEQRNAEEKAATNTQWTRIAELWREKVQRVEELKREIIGRRGESLTLLDDLLARKDVVIEYVKLRQAELVVQELQNISDQFEIMNEGLEKMVQIAGELGPAEQ